MNKLPVEYVIEKSEYLSTIYAESLLGYHVLNPYHNDRHCLLVANSALEYYYNSSGYRHFKPSFKTSQIEILITASLFHDFNHSGGSHGDRWNIDAALAGLNNSSIKSDQLKEVTEIITVTEYFDNKFTKSPTTELQMIVRDADLSMIYYDEGLSLTLGLRYEMEKSLNRVLEVEDFVDNSIKFLSGAALYTDYTKLQKRLHFDSRTKYLKTLIESPSMSYSDTSQY